eukprot:6340486-Pyramimonas_sp.AAC.1
MPPIFLELRVRGLKWPQDLFERDDTSAQVLSVVFWEFHAGPHSRPAFQDIPEILQENHNAPSFEGILNGRED